MPHTQGMPRYHCGVPAYDTCPVCGETGLAAKYLASEGLDTPPVGETAEDFGGPAEDFPLTPAQEAANEADAQPEDSPAPNPFPVPDAPKPKKGKKGGAASDHGDTTDGSDGA